MLIYCYIIHMMIKYVRNLILFGSVLVFFGQDFHRLQATGVFFSQKKFSLDEFRGGVFLRDGLE